MIITIKKIYFPIFLLPLSILGQSNWNEISSHSICFHPSVIFQKKCELSVEGKQKLDEFAALANSNVECIYEIKITKNKVTKSVKNQLKMISNYLNERKVSSIQLRYSAGEKVKNEKDECVYFTKLNTCQTK